MGKKVKVAMMGEAGIQERNNRCCDRVKRDGGLVSNHGDGTS